MKNEALLTRDGEEVTGWYESDGAWSVYTRQSYAHVVVRHSVMKPEQTERINRVASCLGCVIGVDYRHTCTGPTIGIDMNGDRFQVVDAKPRSK